MKYIITSIFLVVTLNALSQKSVYDIARTGSVLEMKKIVETNANIINETNADGYSALILATYRSNNDVAKFLVENVRDLDQTSSMGSALMAATYKGNLTILKLLLKKGVNPNIQDANGQTALMLAVLVQNKEIIKLLIEHKSDLNIRDNKNKQVLDYALQSNNQSVIKLFKNKMTTSNY